MFTSNCHFHSTSQLSLSSHNQNVKYFLTIKSKFLHITIIFFHNQCSQYESDSKLNIVGKWYIILSSCFVCFDVNLNLLRNKYFVCSKYMGKLNLSKWTYFPTNIKKCRSLKDLSQEIFSKCIFIPLPDQFFLFKGCIIFPNITHPFKCPVRRSLLLIRSDLLILDECLNIGATFILDNLVWEQSLTFCTLYLRNEVNSSLLSAYNISKKKILIRPFFFFSSDETAKGCRKQKCFRGGNSNLIFNILLNG